MAKRKNNYQAHLKKPIILLLIGLAIAGGFWLSFISITTSTNTDSQAANYRKDMSQTRNDVRDAQMPTPTKAPTATPKATATQAPGYVLNMTNPKAGNTYAAPLNLPVGGTIRGDAAYTTARIDLQIFKYPINTNTPLASQVITDITSANGVYSFGNWFTANLTAQGEYIIQIVPRNSTGTIIGNPKEIRFFVENIPTKTPTPTPRSATISPTGFFR